MMQKNKFTVSFDAVLAMTVTEAENIELSQLPSLEEMNKEFKRSKEFEKNTSNTIKATKRKEQNKKLGKRIKHIVQIFFVATTVFALSLSPVQAVQEAVAQTLIEWRNGFSSLIFSTNFDTAQNTLPENIEFGYIPEGYILDESSVIHAVDRYFAIFKNGNEMLSISISLINNEITTNTDNEDSKFVIVEFDNIRAYYIFLSDDQAKFTYAKNNKLYQIIGEISLSDFIKVSENIFS